MRFDELSEIIEKHPVCIPIVDAAAFVGVSPQCLRASIDQNRCPFGFSWQIGDRKGYKIPTIAFATWLTKGTIMSNYSNPRN